METILKRVLIIAAIITGFFWLVTLMLPNEFVVSRRVEVKAPDEVVFQYIADLSNWEKWTVLNKQQDSTLKFTYSKFPQGVGATMRWESEHSGNGSVNILQSNPNEGVIYRLVLEDRLIGEGSILFDQSSAHTTNVIWTITGKLSGNLLMRYFTLFMDQLMGPEMEKGLKNLKERSEKDAVNPG